MQTKITFWRILGFSALIALLLSACQVNIKTNIDQNGAGSYIQEIGFQGDEASLSGLNVDDEDFCTAQMDSLPPNTQTRQETRNGDETWCVYETQFESLEALRAIYGMTDTQINTLEMIDGSLNYDITLDLQSSENAPMGADLFWEVTLPGEITSHNADEVDGNTLTWKLRAGETNSIQASSQVRSFTFNFADDYDLTYILGGLMVMACCFLVLIVIGVVVFLVLRRRKTQANSIDAVKSQGAG
jgi:hypothetical protein